MWLTLPNKLFNIAVYWGIINMYQCLITYVRLHLEPGRDKFVQRPTFFRKLIHSFSCSTDLNSFNFSMLHALLSATSFVWISNAIEIRDSKLDKVLWSRSWHFIFLLSCQLDSYEGKGHVTQCVKMRRYIIIPQGIFTSNVIKQNFNDMRWIDFSLNLMIPRKWWRINMKIHKLSITT